MALKGEIYHRPEYKPSTPSQNQTGGTNHGSNGLRDEFTLSTYVHSTPGMKQSAADAIGNTIRNVICPQNQSGGCNLQPPFKRSKYS